MFRLLKLLCITAVAVILVFLGHEFLLAKAGTYLYQKDELKPADVIVVLAGEDTERVEYGVKLFKEGWARKDSIIMSGGPAVWKYTWSSLMKEHAVHLGVPAKAIILQDKSRTTEEDLKYTKEILQKHGFKSLLLVTSPYHSKRAYIIFRKGLDKDITIISAPAEDSWFRFDEWWKRRRERSFVLNEYSKFIWLWIFGMQ